MTEQLMYAHTAHSYNMVVSHSWDRGSERLRNCSVMEESLVLSVMLCHQASILSKDTLGSLTHAPVERAVPGSAAARLWRLYYTRASLQRHFLNIQECYLMMRASDIFSGELSEELLGGRRC